MKYMKLMFTASVVAGALFLMSGMCFSEEQSVPAPPPGAEHETKVSRLDETRVSRLGRTKVSHRRTRTRTSRPRRRMGMRRLGRTTRTTAAVRKTRPRRKSRRRFKAEDRTK